MSKETFDVLTCILWKLNWICSGNSQHDFFKPLKHRSPYLHWIRGSDWPHTWWIRCGMNSVRDYCDWSSELEHWEWQAAGTTEEKRYDKWYGRVRAWAKRIGMSIRKCNRVGELNLPKVATTNEVVCPQQPRKWSKRLWKLLRMK